MPISTSDEVTGDSHATRNTKKKASRQAKNNPSTSHLDQNAQLLEAIAQGKIRSVKRLLDSRADPNYQGGTKKTSPLMRACEIREEETRESIVDLLFNKGVDINLQDASGQTALMKALVYGISTATRILRKGADVSIEDVDGNIALSYAAESGDAEHTHMLLREGKRKRVNIDHQNLHGLTPLLLAAREGHLETAKVLVEGGASSSKRDLEHFMTAHEWMKLTGCYSDHELEFLAPSSKKKNFYRQERLKKGIKTLADYLPTVATHSEGDHSPNVFLMHKKEHKTSTAFQFPTLSTPCTAEPPMKSMFDIPASKKQSLPVISHTKERRSSISFPTVSSVKTDLYKSSYLSRRKSILLTSSLSDGYHSGALAPLANTTTTTPSKNKKDVSTMKNTKLPPIKLDKFS